MPSSLCEHCRRGAVLETADGATRIYCEAIGLQALRVTVAVRSCSRFEGRTSLTSADIYALGWLLDLEEPATRRGPVGFTATPPDRRDAEQERVITRVAIRTGGGR